MLSKIFMASTAVLLLGLVATGWMLTNAYEEVGIQKANVEVAKAAAVEAVANFDDMQEDYARQAKMLSVMTDQSKLINASYQEDLNELNSFRDRLGGAAIGRPELVRRAADRAVARRMRGIQCAADHQAAGCLDDAVQAEQTEGADTS